MCICGLNRDFSECCETIILHKRQATSPEELMRSRYSAYTKADVKYLLFSCAKESRYPEDSEAIEEFASGVEWLKLDVLEAEGERVEFKAYYRDKRDKEGIKVLHEKSSFLKEDGVWKYKDGELYNSKVERNEICPCGSGKKYKKCCA